MDEEARDISTKALRLPTSVRYLEDKDDEDKDMAFDVETVERIKQARYEEAILQRATTPGGQQRGRGYGRAGMQTHHKGRQNHFFWQAQVPTKAAGGGTTTIPAAPQQLNKDGATPRRPSTRESRDDSALLDTNGRHKAKSLRLSIDDQMEADKAVDQFLNSDIIERSPTQNQDSLSQMFVVREKDKCQHFKMESVPILRDLIEAGDWMCKIDLKDAYTMVPIHLESRQYLFFPSPCKNEGRNVQECSDDVNSPEQARIHHQLFQKQAYTEEDTNFLGFQFNTKTMTISIPTTKMEKLTSRVKQLLKSLTKKPCRWLASLIGKITAMIPAMGDALLHVRFLQRDLARSLGQQRQNWEASCQLSPDSQRELEWWLTMSSKRNGLPIRTENSKLEELPKPESTIYVDTSDSGWGISSESIIIYGFWSEAEKEDSINVWELKTILFAIRYTKNEAEENMYYKMQSEVAKHHKYTVCSRINEVFDNINI
ncbi:hypothetical protein G6F68_000460 [Rhizopus microsporus]|nr:hypothetical protein G6F67_000246 [Rhizopus microsporus]KAG1269214.1 hypothetical protein G6F68_000460 [Rhizopus microsporus]